MIEKKIIRDMFLKNIGTQLDELDDDKEFNQIDNWDSLKHVQFIIELEGACDVMLSAEELESGNTVNKLLEIINKK